MSSTSLLHRLSLAQKFIILGLLALFMIVVPSVLNVQRAMADLTQAQREDKGGPGRWFCSTASFNSRKFTESCQRARSMATRPWRGGAQACAIA